MVGPTLKKYSSPEERKEAELAIKEAKVAKADIKREMLIEEIQFFFRGSRHRWKR